MGISRRTARLLGATSLSVAMMIAGAASAQQAPITTSYSYDPLGRLQMATYSAGGDPMSATTYTLDAAGNRTAMTPTQSGLLSNQILAPGQQLVSPVNSNGQTYQLTMQSQDGNLVVSGPNGPSGPGGAVWSTNTAGHAGAYAQFGANGVLTVYAPQGNVLWVSDNYEGAGGHIYMQNDGNLVIYDSNHVARWASNNASLTSNDRLLSSQSLLPGDQLVSSDGRFTLQFQNSGQLVLSYGQGVLWSTAAAASPSYLQMQSNGDLVLHAAAGATSIPGGVTAGNSGAYLVMQTDGNLVIYASASAGGAALWATGTGGRTMAVNDSVTTPVNSPLTFNPLVNDLDTNAYGISVQSATQGAHGTTSYTGSTITYTPASGWSGTDSFNYTIVDGHGRTSTAQDTVTVQSPASTTAVNDSISTTVNTPVSFNPLSNDQDPNNYGLSVQSATQGANGSTSFTGSSITYTPVAGWSGNDAFNYTIVDGHGNTSTAQVTVSVAQPYSPPPIAVNDSVNANTSTAVTFNPLSNDYDPSGYSLSIQSATQGAHGSTTYNASSITYTPLAGYDGPDSFNYTISNGHGGTASAQVNVTVATAPAQVTANSLTLNIVDSYSVPTTVTPAGSIAASGSSYEGYPLTIVGVTNGAKGTASFSATTNTLGYQYNTAVHATAQTFNDTDSFTYTLSDGHGNTSTATVTVNITVGTSQ